MSPTVLQKDRMLGGLWDSLVGDALGVPVEFKDRATVQVDPVTGMREYGTHRQPKATCIDGQFRMVEVGDGQVSDLVGLQPEQFAPFLSTFTGKQSAPT